MAPWNRLRPDRSSDKDGKKRINTQGRPQSRPQSPPQSQLQSAEETPPTPTPENGSTATSAPAPTKRRNHRTRDSVVSLSAVQDSSTKSEANPPRVPLLELPEAETGTSRPQRFSLLRFRHASDSQLSKTAQEHAFSPPPPVPGELDRWQPKPSDIWLTI
jgi:hypothetical protein